jgi:hypothetical protein
VKERGFAPLDSRKRGVRGIFHGRLQFQQPIIQNGASIKRMNSKNWMIGLAAFTSS